MNKREKLKQLKPLVYEKINKFDDKLKRGESIGIIQLQYRYMCNYDCKHCSIAGFQHLPQRLNPEVVKNIYTQADKLGLARTTITGGEPLIFPDLKELIKAINPDKFYISIDTNGEYLTKEVIKTLKELGVDRLQPSIDSLDAKEHDEFRRSTGSHAKVIKGVDLILDAGMDIFVQTVVTRDRMYSDEFIKYIEFFNNKGVDVFVTFAKPVGAYAGQFDNLITKKELDYMSELEKKYKIFTHLTPNYGCSFGCPAGKNIYSITAQGDVLICPYYHCSMGNIFDEPLEAILNRLVKCKPFIGDTCFLAEDKAWIDKYLVQKIYNKRLPVHYTEVFTKEDFE
jgi:MoaA/NifB/PqqE/SkfB family radical SAM enzyme